MEARRTQVALVASIPQFAPLARLGQRPLIAFLKLSRVELWLILNRFWLILNPFWLILNPFWLILNPFWLILNPFWLVRIVHDFGPHAPRGHPGSGAGDRPAGRSQAGACPG